MSARWVSLEQGTDELRSALWTGFVTLKGERLRAVPRELIFEGEGRKVLFFVDPPQRQVPGFLKRWAGALRWDRAFFLLGTALWVGVLGMAQDWSFRWSTATLAVVGALALHLAVNAFAEIQDTLRLVDFSRWYGVSRESSAVLEGWVTLEALSRVGWGFLVLSFLCGMPLLWWHSRALLPMAVMGAVSAWGYAHQPLSLKYRGWGEFFIFLASGPALALALSWCFFERWSPAMASLGFCVGFWNLAYHHSGNLPDADQDRESGLKTWVLRLGFLRARWLLFPLSLLSWLAWAPALISGAVQPLYVFALVILLVPQWALALRVSRASGCASIWLVGLRRRAWRVQLGSFIGALMLSLVFWCYLGG
ncbi:MAG: hypothetical protein RJB38_2186, partial [Pseudomonadota bacterium]